MEEENQQNADPANRTPPINSYADYRKRFEERYFGNPSQSATPSQSAKQEKKQTLTLRENIQYYWEVIGKIYIPGLWFHKPINSILNFFIYAGGSLALAIKLSDASDTFITSLFLFIGFFLLFSFINFIIIFTFRSSRYSEYWKRMLIFSLPFFISILALFIPELAINFSFLLLLISLGLSIFLCLISGSMLTYLSAAMRLPGIKRNSFLRIFGTAILLSFIFVTAGSFWINANFGGTFASFFITISRNDIILFLFFLILCFPFFFLGTWYLYTKWEEHKPQFTEKINLYLKRYNQIKTVVLQFFKDTHFNKLYYSIWIILLVLFILAVLLDWCFIHIPTFGTSRVFIFINSISGLFIFIAAGFTPIILFLLSILLFLVTFEYVFMPEALKTIQIKIPRFVSGQLVKAIITFIFLFLAWWFYHSIVVYSIQIHQMLERSIKETYVSLFETFMYTYSHMTGFDLTFYQPTDTFVRGYTLIITITSFLLLVVFISTALDQPNEQPTDRPDEKPATES